MSQSPKYSNLYYLVFQVFDNASYHSQKDENNTPRWNWRKPRLIDWLKAKKVDFPQDGNKKEIWKIAREKSLEEPRFKVDDLIRSFGHDVLRLPPYHCDLNPIERI